MADKRLHFSIARRFVEPGSLVFLDEAGARTSMTRLYGRSPAGQRCIDHTPHGHWQTMTMLSAIRLDGVIPEATLLFDGPMNSQTFLGYIEHCLAPALRPGDVVVMDNLPAHKDPRIRESIEKAEADLWYLPPYSPDLSPIENLWSKVKTWLRDVGGRTWEEVTNALADVLRRVTRQECRNYFNACGYGH